jgi:serine/threonine-protein kinase ATR
MVSSFCKSESCRMLTLLIDVLLNYVEGMTVNTVNRIAPFAVEASWATGRWQTLEKYLRLYNAGDVSEVFNLGVGQALLCLRDGNVEKFKEHVQMLRDKVSGSMTYSATSSLRASHDAMLKCHVLSDLEMIADEKLRGDGDQQSVLTALDRRLEVLGAYVSDKQYLLGIRRAAMELMRYVYLRFCQWKTTANMFKAQIRKRGYLLTMAV